jgi:hypothetical protein
MGLAHPPFPNPNRSESQQRHGPQKQIPFPPTSIEPNRPSPLLMALERLYLSHRTLPSGSTLCLTSE